MEKALKTLEWEKIIEEIEKEAESSGGREYVLSLKPSTDAELIERWHLLNNEAFKTIQVLGYSSFSGIKDIRSYLERAKMGGIVYPDEFEEILSTIESWKRLREYQEKAKILAANLWKNTIHSLSSLYHEIKKCIQNGEVLDSASPELRSIRQKKEKIYQKNKEALENILQKEWRAYLQDNIITIRHGRYVLPVKQEFRNKVQGIVHDQSTSGLTVYIEPLSVVELNNQISILENEEKKEIEKILLKLTSLLLSHEEELRENFEITSYLDFVYAKIRWADKRKGIVPILEKEKQTIILREARHPFLGERAIPISLEVGRTFNTLVITGPNTGGKTVTLKTIGLFVLLNQAGIPVLAKEGTTLGIFNEIFADIGDEQSIEQNLSTFSSHLTNIVSFIDYLERTGDKKVLVLLDELGAGTDPQEGAALAVALLEYFHQKGTINVVATHYPQLKVIASKYPEMENASMEFDEKTLRPLYRINLGIPGKSNAILIAKRLGLPRKILDRALSLLSEDEIKLEEVIGELHRDRKKLQEEIEKVNRVSKELEEEKVNLEKEKRNLQKEKEELREKQKKELFKEISLAESKLKEIIKKMQEEKISMKDTQELQEELKGIKRDFTTEEKKERKEYIPHIGEKIKLKSSSKEGIVLEIDPEKKTALLQVGILKVSVPWSDIEPGENSEELVPVHVKVKKEKYVPTEINIRKMTVDEGIEEVKKFLERAFLAGLPRVRIIHGRGTGKLRNAVHQYLSEVPYVKEFYLASAAEGGEGATIVLLESPRY
ncbi:MAG TPA: endonuclease MutS2 [Dictyoglomaceae bacterium]|nr:endonuclease MutS2 [Dictyoglomaceae bacterium]